MRNASVSSAGYSNYSRYSSRYSLNTSPPGTTGNGIYADATYGVGSTMGMVRENGVLEFKNYLEDTTALLVRSIQPLVSTVRSNPTITTNDPAVSSYVLEISTTVNEIVAKTNAAVVDLNNAALKKHAPPVVNVLDETARDLVNCRQRGDATGLSQYAFRIARATKELVLRVDRIEQGEVTEASSLPLEV